MPNLIKLYTRHGAIWVNTEQLARKRTQCSIYTSHGNRLIDTFKTKADYAKGSTVHFDNLFATPELAKADSDRIYADMVRSVKESKYDYWEKARNELSI